MIKKPKPKPKPKLEPYDERSDSRKIRSQWSKLTGLHNRNEPSAAIVRAATAAELAVNLAIRYEFTKQSKLRAETINLMLKKANGLWGKMACLLLPLVIGQITEPEIRKLNKLSEGINKTRNEIVHSGRFSSRNEALKAIEKCRNFIESLVKLYETDFSLPSLNLSSIKDAEKGGEAKEVAVGKPKPRPAK